MSYYDKKQEDLGGLSLEQRKAQVTAAWERRDTPRAFLEKEFPRDSLPTVDEARALASAHRAAMELFSKGEQRAARDAKEKERREDLQRRQLPRRQTVEQEAKTLADRQRQARYEHSERQKEARAALRQSYLQESRRIKSERVASRPKGLAAFLGRITGVELITKKVHQYRDATRYKAFLAQKKELTEHQQREHATFERRQALEKLTMQRCVRALELVEQRERKSLEMALLKERRVEDRRSTEQKPAPEPTHTDLFNDAAKKPIDLTAKFERVAGSGDDKGGTTGESAQEPAPEAEVTIQRRKVTRDRSHEGERSTKGKRADRDRENDDGPSDNDPTPRRRRDRDFDRGR